ncbi:MAG TPA: hypothetical protein VFE47_09800 [Tepidisphaeraceae bacterium]|nr:hypothetical protein [Tepidisphaeraceae bacterium]
MTGFPSKRFLTFGCLLFATTAMIAGCGWQKPAPVAQEKYDSSRSVVVHMAPKELVKKIQAELSKPPLGLSIESVQDGVIFTGWKEYEGAVHIARRWRERTRFKINVLPDFNDPLGTSHVDVFDETEEKPSDPQPWYPNPELRRPERSDEVVKVIEGMK